MIGMLGILMQRIENSALENETFVEYFQSYIKIWNDHSNSIEKNAQMFLKPMRLEHEKQGSKFKDFMHQVESLLPALYLPKPSSSDFCNYTKKQARRIPKNWTKCCFVVGRNSIKDASPKN